MEDNKVDDKQGGETHQKAAMTDRVNVEPPILNGMTASEAKIIAIVATAFWGLIGALGAALFHIWPIFIVSLVVLPITTLWVGSVRLATVKRGRPDGYYGQAMQLWAVKRGFAKNKFIGHDGFWDIGVTSDLALSSELEVDKLRKESFQRHSQPRLTEQQPLTPELVPQSMLGIPPVQAPTMRNVVKAHAITGLLNQAKSHECQRLDQEEDHVCFAQSTIGATA